VWVVPDIGRILWFVVGFCMWVPAVIIRVASGWEIAWTSKKLSRMRPTINNNNIIMIIIIVKSCIIVYA
jgi:hypothetical protein